MNNANIKTAKKFYKEIEKEKENYKLINGLFIVKYINKVSCVLIAEVFKTDSKGYKIKRVYSNQLFNKKKGLTTSSLGIWKKLNISFIETPIEDILKW